MARKTLTFDDVRQLTRTLPRVEEGTTYGSPAVKLDGKMFACLPSHRSAEPDSLVVLIDFEQRDALIAEAPETYYLKEHYVNHPCVLVRLRRIEREALRDLLAMAHRFVSLRSRRRRAPRPRASARPRLRR